MATVKNQYGKFESKNKIGRPKKTKGGVRIDPKTGKAASGRPTKMTKEVLKKLEEAFLMDCTDEEACLYAQITPATLYNYQKQNPEYLELKKMYKQRPFLLARKSVIEGMQVDPNLALKYLERKKKDEFSLRSETDITTQGNALPTIQIIKNYAEKDTESE